ncbi:ATP-dependent Clp protease adapter ClpS [Propionimicrobium lymphophilum]|uniref:ATP-dependent Clp protease adapter ClpS n=1 Tax=Propionimicrobium lymphophilum TaxID=33012 RepID=UPI00288A7BA1|nr:ATP-dependent Clp protease adapter ClpS [Propionimicrobium lymphophilum]
MTNEQLSIGATSVRPNAESTLLADKPWVTVVWDDPINLMSYVAHVFSTYFDYDHAKAETLMMQVHMEGKAAVSSGVREAMERDVQAMHQYGLWATLDRGA